MLDKVLFLHVGMLPLSGDVESLKQENNMSLLNILNEVYEDARI